MTGGGLCWLGLRLGRLESTCFIVNSYSDQDVNRWEARGGLPRSVSTRNERGRFTNVSKKASADLEVKGQGCVAADFTATAAPTST